MIKLKNLAIAALSLAAILSHPAEAKKKPVAVFQEPSAMQGLIIFFRNGSMVGSALACDVRENGNLVGNLGNSMVFGVAFDAGVHAFNPKGDAANTVSIDVTTGNTYYVNCAFSGGRITLTRSDQEHFEEKYFKLTVKTPDELAKEVAKDAARKKK